MDVSLRKENVLRRLSNTEKLYTLRAQLPIKVRFFRQISPDLVTTKSGHSTFKAGEEITIQYISFMYGHLRRKKSIKECWFFECLCKRYFSKLPIIFEDK